MPEQKPRVLIVDDDPDLVQAYVASLEKVAHVVSADDVTTGFARSARDCLNMERTHMPPSSWMVI